jgi:hypothetical protein
MTTFDRELTGRYVAAGSDRPDPESRRVARAVLVRDTIRALRDADKRFSVDPADNSSLAELVDAAEEHLEHVANEVSRSVTTKLTTGGETA